MLGSPFRDIEKFPAGVLATFYPDHPERLRRDRLEPADSASLGGIAALLRGKRNLRVLFVVHTDPVSSGRLGRKITHDELEREAAGYVDWFRQQGVSASRLRTVVVNDAEPAASPSTLLGRQFDRRLEVAIKLPRAAH
jgi:outer membrane protein OmpA-like peptidoglycan-associated protein